MLKTILNYGVIAGLVAGAGLSIVVATMSAEVGHGWAGMAVGYTIMLVALTAIFLGVKHERDVGGGGVIRFWPAFGMGLAISAVAGVCYVIAWEAAQAFLIQGDFATTYGASAVADARTSGASAAAVTKLEREMAEFAVRYRDPLFRLPMTFMEIFPVGVLVSLISAALLCNTRFMARRTT